MIGLRIVAVVLGAVILGATTAGAEIIDFKTRGKLAHLTQFAGTNNHRAILDDPYVAETLKKLSGEYYEKFNNFNLSITHVELSSPFIILRGSRWIDAFRPEFFLVILIDWENGAIHAAIDFVEGMQIVFSDRKSFRNLPSDIRYFINRLEVFEVLDRQPNARFRWYGRSHPDR